MDDRLMFRYYHKKKNRYLNVQTMAINNGVFVRVSFRQSNNGCFYPYIGESFNDSEIIAEQCTGLRDKNGKLIYENDLIDFYGKIYQIIWDNDFACFSIKNNNSMHPISDITQSIVLGNIHKNHKLLEQ